MLPSLPSSPFSCGAQSLRYSCCGVPGLAILVINLSLNVPMQPFVFRGFLGPHLDHQCSYPDGGLLSPDSTRVGARASFGRKKCEQLPLCSCHSGHLWSPSCSLQGGSEQQLQSAVAAAAVVTHTNISTPELYLVSVPQTGFRQR